MASQRHHREAPRHPAGGSGLDPAREVREALAAREALGWADLEEPGTRPAMRVLALVLSAWIVAWEVTEPQPWGFGILLAVLVAMIWVSGPPASGVSREL